MISVAEALDIISAVDGEIRYILVGEDVHEELKKQICIEEQLPEPLRSNLLALTGGELRRFWGYPLVVTDGAYFQPVTAAEALAEEV